MTLLWEKDQVRNGAIMRSNPKNHLIEFGIILGAIILFYASLSLQVGLILGFICISMLALLAFGGLAEHNEPEAAKVVVIVEDDIDRHPYKD